jgi:hypothetical protein
MTYLTDRLDAIQKRTEQLEYSINAGTEYDLRDDAGYSLRDIKELLVLARKQQAAIDAVRDIAASIPRSLARENNEPSEADYALLGFSNRITEALEAKP